MISQKEGFHPLLIVWARKAQIIEENGHYKLILSDLDPKVLYSSTRPSRVQEYLNIDYFMSVWIDNEKYFVDDPAEIAICYTEMKPAKDGICYAIPIQLSHPKKNNNHSWQFDLSFSEKNMLTDVYKDVALFIDWIPSADCPIPVKILFPEVYS